MVLDGTCGWGGCHLVIFDHVFDKCVFDIELKREQNHISIKYTICVGRALNFSTYFQLKA